MALVPCPECHKEVSTQAMACPQCAFPFPGKHGRQEGGWSGILNTCQGCGNPVSQQARSCPHCGVKLKGSFDYHGSNGDQNEETWICSHCGMPQSQKNIQGEDVFLGHQEESSQYQPDNGLQTPMLGEVPGPDNSKLEASSGPRRHSPLWEASSKTITSTTKEISSSPYPRQKRKSIIVGVLLMVLVAVSVVMGALWQLKGLNPLETLIYWRM